MDNQGKKAQRESKCSETKPLVHHHVSMKEYPKRKLSKKCFPNGYKYRLILINSKKPIIFIVWNALLAVTMSFQAWYVLMIAKDFNQMLAGAISVFFFPIIGWLADVKLGRYTIMKASLSLLFFSNTLLIFHYVMTAYLTTNTSDIVSTAGSFFLYLALSCYTSSFLQFVTDQQFEASSEELSFTIYWIMWSVTFATMIGLCINCVASEITLIISIASSISSWLVAVIVLLKYRHLVVMAPLNPNPIKQIAHVLLYAWKHKYPTRRSALTYWEEDYPSRIDLGKSKYGGPFTVEEVEDVKTVLRLIPMVLVISVSVGILFGLKFEGKYMTESIYCAHQQLTTTISISIFIVGLPIYHFIIYPLFYNYIPTILQRLHIGMFLILTFFLVGTIINLVGGIQGFDESVSSAHDWLAFPLNSLLAFGPIITIISMIEFVYAQTLHQIKSFVIQMAFMFIIFFSSVSHFVNLSVQHFSTQYFPGRTFYFYLLDSIITLTSFTFFVFISKRYKLRITEDIIPYHTFAEEFVENDMRRRDAFYLQRELEYERLD